MPGEAATAGQAYGEIKRMMVDPAARGAGIGAAVLAGWSCSWPTKGCRWPCWRPVPRRPRRWACTSVRATGAGAAFAGYPDNGLSLFYEKRLGR